MELIRLALGKELSIQEDKYLKADWNGLQALAEQQGLLPIVLDDIKKLLTC